MESTGCPAKKVYPTLRYTNADLKIPLSPYICLFSYKRQHPENFAFLILRSFAKLSFSFTRKVLSHLPAKLYFSFTRKVCEMLVYKHTETRELKSSIVFKQNTNFTANNYRIRNIKNAKFSGYYFNMN